MDLELSADQEELQAAVRKLCEGRFPMARVRALVDEHGVNRELWRALADAGVFTLGALGMGVADAVVVFEELGRALVPGPLVWTYLAGADEAVIGGTTVGATPLMVEHLPALDALMVIRDDGVTEVDAEEVEGVAVGRPLDPLTPLHRVDVLPAGRRVGDRATAERWRTVGAALTAAYLSGMAAAVTDLAVDYARQREQFGRPIGSFQAVKHLLADMFVRTELARAAVYAAGVTVDDPEVGDVSRAVSAAKLLAGEAGLANAKASLQVHGGMGFTWEVDVHLYMKRAWVLDTAFGSADDHAEAVAARLGQTSRAVDDQQYRT